MHQAPQKRWTVPDLSAAVGLSRSPFAAKVTALVGHPRRRLWVCGCLQHSVHARIRDVSRTLSARPRGWWGEQRIKAARGQTWKTVKRLSMDGRPSAPTSWVHDDRLW